jgi:hypothetical protein
MYKLSTISLAILSAAGAAERVFLVEEILSM